MCEISKAGDCPGCTCNTCKGVFHSAVLAFKQFLDGSPLQDFEQPKVIKELAPICPGFSMSSGKPQRFWMPVDTIQVLRAGEPVEVLNQNGRPFLCVRFPMCGNAKLAETSIENGSGDGRWLGLYLHDQDRCLKESQLQGGCLHAQAGPLQPSYVSTATLTAEQAPAELSSKRGPVVELYGPRTQYGTLTPDGANWRADSKGCPVLFVDSTNGGGVISAFSSDGCNIISVSCAVEGCKEALRVEVCKAGDAFLALLCVLAVGLLSTEQQPFQAGSMDG